MQVASNHGYVPAQLLLNETQQQRTASPQLAGLHPNARATHTPPRTPREGSRSAEVRNRALTQLLIELVSAGIVSKLFMISTI